MGEYYCFLSDLNTNVQYSCVPITRHVPSTRHGLGLFSNQPLIDLKNLESEKPLEIVWIHLQYIHFLVILLKIVKRKSRVL